MLMYNLIEYTLHEKPYFLFPNVLKRWSFQKNCAGMWSFLYYQERWYFLFPKISSYSLNEKLKMIFPKKIHGNMIFSSNVLKRWPFQQNCTGIWSFLCYLERRYFFLPENIIFFLLTENKRQSFSRNTWKYDIYCIFV